VFDGYFADAFLGVANPSWTLGGDHWELGASLVELD
jgi:hypothetical protein